MSRCDVILENYDTCYVNGDTIIGYVQVTLCNPKPVKGIFIKFKGEAKTEWPESETRYNQQTQKDEIQTIWYSSLETIFNTEITLFGNNGLETILSQGVHKYPFTFKLPRNIPSTFNNTYGKIKYVLKAKVQRPTLAINYTAESPFKVLSLIDFNQDLLYTRNEAVVNKSKAMGICCWSSGAISIQLQLPATGFALGENVPINLHVENLSRTSIEDVTFEIKEKIQYIARYPRENFRQTEERVARKVATGVGAHGERTYNELLLIPKNFYAPNLSGCTNINSYYTLKMDAFLPCPHSNIKEKISIKIGHIPVRVNTVTRPVEQIGFGSLIETPPPYNPSVVPPDISSLTIASAPSSSSTIPTAPSVSTDSERIYGFKVGLPQTSNEETLPPTYEEAIEGK